MQQIKQSESVAARRRIPFRLVDATDGVTPEPGLTFTDAEIQVLKNGGAWANFAGSVTDKGNGSYDYDATAGEVDTFGPLQVRVNKAGAREFVALVQVVAIDPYNAAAQFAAADRQILAAGVLQGGTVNGAQLAADQIPLDNGFQYAGLIITHASGFRETTGIASSLEADDSVVFTTPLKVAAAAGELYEIIAGTPAALEGTPKVDLDLVGGSAARRAAFAAGLDIIPGLTVTTTGLTPTASLFRVTGMPVLGFADNPRGRGFYFHTGANNIARRFIKSCTFVSTGVYDLEFTEPFLAAPAGDDQGYIR